MGFSSPHRRNSKRRQASSPLIPQTVAESILEESIARNGRPGLDRYLGICFPASDVPEARGRTRGHADTRTCIHTDTDTADARFLCRAVSLRRCLGGCMLRAASRACSSTPVRSKHTLPSSFLSVANPIYPHPAPLSAPTAAVQVGMVQAGSLKQPAFLGHSQLRGTPACHARYLSNMWRAYTLEHTRPTRPRHASLIRLFALASRP